jgi:hypothetical protein
VEDGVHAVTGRIRATGEAFAGQQGKPAELATTLEGARSVDAGDAPGLTSQIQSMVTDFVTALNGIAAGLQQDAAMLQKQAGNYQAGETTKSQVLDASRAKIEQKQ